MIISQPGHLSPGFFMDIEIRPARDGDIQDVIRLMREFAEYEKLIDSFEVTAEKLTDVLFGQRKVADMVVAAETSAPVGYALFYPYFASFRGQRGLYLEDIYVSTEFRGRGVGERLLRAVAMAAVERGCERIDFQVLEWNEPAISFYEKVGADRNDDERHFKFSDAAFRRLAGQA
ncbi:MAG TPA: GNAT family N-acetyltransferase [Pyrinomonadaceae bacterium]|jgi:hypothetical protein